MPAIPIIRSSPTATQQHRLAECGVEAMPTENEAMSGMIEPGHSPGPFRLTGVDLLTDIAARSSDERVHDLAGRRQSGFGRPFPCALCSATHRARLLFDGLFWWLTVG